ncbi:HCL608Cp [Eremothecium sinecaudum]|uniref:HCL608Cp n=1 Tax=Eremothecium sinecaudum TaxID=45286 RepID=A0A109UXW2_9SACH|nr:HCL608Cp [Eremothecium sinecaudum]AMD19543.1 HCL608Cp [Eremothecium sinecaudum]
MSGQDETKKDPSQQEESIRISTQVSSLSTRLIESIDKQSKLEEQLNHARRILAGQKSAMERHESLKQELEQLKQVLNDKDKQLTETKEKLDEASKGWQASEQKVQKVHKELEDLTTSLFDEANNMVSKAREEKHAIEQLNSKLQEQLREKDMLLDTLSIQLKNLKKVLYKVEDEQNTINNYRRPLAVDEHTGSNLSLDRQASVVDSAYDLTQASLLFTPLAQSLRYDIPLYTEYLRFVAVLPMCKSIKDTKHDSKFLRGLINEIHPILRLESAAGLGWLARRNLLNLMIEGLVVIEPISGINETYRLGYMPSHMTGYKSDEGENVKMFNYPPNSPPVAIEAPCAFCSEGRNDILEHGRLYTLKTLMKTEDGRTAIESQYPLCHYCLLKVRQVCEIFAFLRSLKSGAWHLENVTLSCAKADSTEFTQVQVKDANASPLKENASSLTSKRLSFMSNFSRNSSFVKTTPKVDGVGEDFDGRKGLPMTNVQRSWLHLAKLRASLYWSHIGVWTLDDAVQLKVAPMSSEDKDPAIFNGDSLPHEWANYGSPSSTNQSFTYNEFGEEGSKEQEGFDFEKGDETQGTIKQPVEEETVKNEVANEVSPPVADSAGNTIESSVMDDVPEDVSPLSESKAPEPSKEPEEVVEPNGPLPGALAE